jgi:hypothetical protein
MHAAIPVICDRCRAEGSAGGTGFADIRDLLAFDPVQRRAHVNNWTAEHQRAFIAALAITGSPRQAARAIGRHAFGAEQLRTAKGGRSFADAWDAAIELAREREIARMHENLDALAAQTAEASAKASAHAAQASAAGLPALRPSAAGGGTDWDTEDADARDYDEAMMRIRMRLTNARRLFLMAICEEEAERAAWEVLVGPVDWDKASRAEPQDDEPFHDAENPGRAMNRMNKPDMLITAESGLLADIAGGYDRMAEIRAGVERILAENGGEDGEGAGAAKRTDDERD